MPSPTFPSFHVLATIATMYAESFPVPVSTWREQATHLMEQYGRDVVIESLMSSIEGLTMREACMVAVAAGQESGRMATA